MHGFEAMPQGDQGFDASFQGAEGQRLRFAATARAVGQGRSNDPLRADAQVLGLGRQPPRSRIVNQSGFWPISKLAMFSSARAIAEWSQALPPCAVQALNSS